MASRATKGMKVKKILISQPEPETKNSPYYDLAEKYKLKLKFKPCIPPPSPCELPI